MTSWAFCNLVLLTLHDRSEIVLRHQQKGYYILICREQEVLSVKMALNVKLPKNRA